ELRVLGYGEVGVEEARSGDRIASQVAGVAHTGDARRYKQSLVGEPLCWTSRGLARSSNVRADGQVDARTGPDGPRGRNRASGLYLLRDSELPAGDEPGLVGLEGQFVEATEKEAVADARVGRYVSSTGGTGSLG